MGNVERQKELRRRRIRKHKVKKLLAKYEKADGAERHRIVQKLWRISPEAIPAEARG